MELMLQDRNTKHDLPRVSAICGIWYPRRHVGFKCRLEQKSAGIRMRASALVPDGLDGCLWAVAISMSHLRDENEWIGGVANLLVAARLVVVARDRDSGWEEERRGARIT